jgi:hypothetical protein
MADELQNAINLLKAGKKVDAGNIFARLVKANPNNEDAWLGLSACVVLENQKRDCLKQVLRINPQNQYAKKAIANLEIASVLEVPSQDEPISNISKKQGAGLNRNEVKPPEHPPVASNAIPIKAFNNIHFTPQIALKIAAAVIIVVLIILGLNWVGNNVGADTFYGHVVGYSWNNLATVQEGGVSVEIARLTVYDKSSLSKQEQKYFATNAFYGLNTICNLYFRITNNTDQIMSVYANQGLLVANGEQVQLSSFMYTTSGTLGGEIFPGATISGVMTFGLKKVTPDTINGMTITFSPPSDKNFISYGLPYVFNLNLSQHEWVDKPDDLK